MGKLLTSRNILIAVVIVVLVSIAFNVYQISRAKQLEEKSLSKCNSDAGLSNFNSLSSDVVWLNVDAFLVGQRRSTLNYASLKNGLALYLQNTNGDYALYYEDLDTGSWFGVNEDETFMPFSLLKIPVMVATLKEVETGKISFNQKVILEKEDIDSNYGELWKKGEGYETTVKDLLWELIKHSDNTALLSLSRHAISEDRFVEAKLAMGLPPLIEDTKVSPKQYSNMLRSLYFSHYLRKPFSELALTLMTDTDFNSQLPAGVPNTVPVAHKVGVYYLEGYYHDCGIIFAEHPYILCVMSKNTEAEEADKVISQVSKIVYDYVSKRQS